MAADCKSAGFDLRRFESCTMHQRICQVRPYPNILGLHAETRRWGGKRDRAERQGRSLITSNNKGRKMTKIEQMIEKMVAKVLGFEADSVSADTKVSHRKLGKRCLIRTYSAGVHIGDVVYANGMEVELDNALRLWKWEDGGLSLSAISRNGIKKGRLNKTGNVYLTNAIEMIETTPEAEASFVRFIED